MERTDSARRMTRIARELVSYDKEMERKMEQYLDQIEEYAVSERLAKYNWQLYDFAINNRGGYEYGRAWSVEPIPKDELSENEEVGDWDDIVNEFEDDWDAIDDGPKVFYTCDEYGPSGYRILGGIESTEEEV